MKWEEMKNGQIPTLEKLDAWLNSIPEEIILMNITPAEESIILQSLLILRRETNIRTPESADAVILTRNRLKRAVQVGGGLNMGGFAQYLKKEVIRVFTDKEILTFLSGLGIGFVYCGFGTFIVLGAVMAKVVDPLPPMLDVARNMLITGLVVTLSSTVIGRCLSARKTPSNAIIMSEGGLKRTADLLAVTNEYRGLAMYLGSVLKSAEKENTSEWMEYRDEVITEAEEALPRLDDSLLNARGMNVAINTADQHNSPVYAPER